MSSCEQEPANKNVGGGGTKTEMSLGELAAALNALGNPVALKIIKTLQKPKPSPQ